MKRWPAMSEPMKLDPDKKYAVRARMWIQHEPPGGWTVYEQVELPEVEHFFPAKIERGFATEAAAGRCGFHQRFADSATGTGGPTVNCSSSS